MNSLDFMKRKYCWRILIGTFFTLFFILIFHYCFVDLIAGMNLAFFEVIILVPIPIFFLGGMTLEYFCRSNRYSKLVSSSIIISIYEDVLYLLLYWVGIEVIIKRAYEEVMFKHNWGLIFLFPVALFFFVLIPGNLIGSSIVYIFRKKGKNSKDN